MNMATDIHPPPSAPSYGPAPEVEGEIDLRHMFELLRAGRWTIAIVTGALVLAGFLYGLIAAPVYQSDGLVQVEKDSKQGSISSQLSDLSSLLEGTPVETEAEIQILKSRMVLDQVIEKMNLLIQVSPRYFPVIGPKLAAVLGHPDHPTSAPAFLRGFAWGGERVAVSTFDVPEEYQDQVFLLKRTESGYVLIAPRGNAFLSGKIGELASVDIGGAHFAVFVRELVAQPGTEFKLVSRSRQSVLRGIAGAMTVMEQGKQSGVIKISLEGGNPAYITQVINNIEDSYLLQNVERRSADAQQSLVFLQKELPDLKAQVEAAQAKLKAYQTEHGSVNVTEETQLILQQSVNLETKRLEIEQQRDEALQKFTAEHPTVKALNDQLHSLQAESGRVSKESGNLPATQQEILNLTRDVEVNSQLYTEMMNSMQQLEIAKAGTVGNVRIVDRALKPKTPIKPQVSLILTIALFIGLLLGITTVFVQRAMLRGVDDPAEVESHFGLTSYALIPYSDEQERLSLAMSREGASGNFLLASLDSNNSAVESLRSLRTSLHFAMVDSPNNIVLLSGPSPGLGKSFVAVNLAAVLALSGKHVVVIDCDLRKGHLERYISAPVEPGIADYIARDVELKGIIRSTPIAGLDLIPRGTHPPNPSELLLHERFRDLLNTLSSQYDYVLVDSPPALAVTDAAIIGRLAGCTLLVLKAAEHPISEIEETLKRLGTAGVSVRGVVFNQMGAKAGSYGYGNYGYSYYGYK